MKIFLKNHLNVTILYSLFVTCLLIANTTKRSFTKPLLVITKQSSALNFKPLFYKFFGLGLSRLYSSYLWIITMAESDLEHYKQPDLNSWIYLRLNSIIDIDPQFYNAYYYGGIYLSIVKDDDWGAKDIYDKGMKQFPKEKDLLLNAGFHYYYELSRWDEAIQIYSLVMDLPNAPFYLTELIARMKSGQNHLVSALELIKHSLKRRKLPKRVLEKLRKNAYALQAEIDLDCLNNEKGNCRLEDFYGAKYLYDSKVERFRSLAGWKPLRIYMPKSRKDQ